MHAEDFHDDTSYEEDLDLDEGFTLGNLIEFQIEKLKSKVLVLHSAVSPCWMFVI